MDEMKYDMCGAASVLGTMQAVAQMKLPLDVVALCRPAKTCRPAMPSRPGDVVIADVQPASIGNSQYTDAEGRLIPVRCAELMPNAFEPGIPWSTWPP